MNLSTGTARVIAGESDAILTSADYRGDGTVMGAIWCHGVGGNHTAITKPSLAGQYAVANAIASKYPLVSGDQAGEHWGNAAGQASVAAARTYLQGTLGAKAGKVILIGVSMGGLLALNYAKANPTHVAAIILLIPMNSMLEAGAGQPGVGFNAAIDTAYGTWNWNTYSPTSDPTTYTPTPDLPPILAYWGTADATCTAAVGREFTKRAQVEARYIVGGTHSEQCILDIPDDEIMTFLARYAR